MTNKQNKNNMQNESKNNQNANNAPAQGASVNTQSAPAKGAVKQAQGAREISLFRKEWGTIKDNFGSANGAYRTMYTFASDNLRAALIEPKVFFDKKSADEIHAKYNAYVAYADEHKGAKGVSAWFAYLWAQKEMREYMTTAKEGDKRAKAIAKVQRTQRAERQNKAAAKK